jgi:hypothetical protein
MIVVPIFFVKHLIDLLRNSLVTPVLINFKVNFYGTSVFASKVYTRVIGRTLISLPQIPDLTKMDVTSGFVGEYILD